MRIFLFILFFLSVSALSIAQSQHIIVGAVPQAAGKDIVLKGFGVERDLAKVTADARGKFALIYSSSYVGAALFEVKDVKNVIVLLNNEDFEINWGNLEEFSTLKFVGSKENDNLSRGMQLYQNIESKKSGLSYLIPLYKKGSFSQGHFKKELKVQENLFGVFLNHLFKDSYVAYYIKLRKLISDMPLTASRYPDRFSENENEFNALDFGDSRMEHSGLYKDLFEGYVQLIESYAGSNVAKMNLHLNASIDLVLKSLKDKPLLLQDMGQNLFNLLEKRSLFSSAEHLALAMLDKNSCQLDEKHQALFEQYRKMAKGKIAPEIVFPKTVNGYYQLSEIKSKYKLVVFGASWCSKCTEDLPKLKSFYEKWKKEGVEVVFVSLDSDKTAFTNFTKDFPWVSSCDYQSWESLAVRDYCVFATPTMYLLDDAQKILAKPISADHLEAILESYKKE